MNWPRTLRFWNSNHLQKSGSHDSRGSDRLCLAPVRLSNCELFLLDWRILQKSMGMSSLSKSENEMGSRYEDKEKCIWLRRWLLEKAESRPSSRHSVITCNMDGRRCSLRSLGFSSAATSVQFQAIIGVIPAVKVIFLGWYTFNASFDIRITIEPWSSHKMVYFWSINLQG